MIHLFESPNENRWFLIAMLLLFVSEGIVSFLAMRGTQDNTKKKEDYGTIWLIMFGWWSSILIAIYLRSPWSPVLIRNWLLLEHTYYFGILGIVLGVILRFAAVLSLKNAFTLSVQTTSEQHLIQTGVYRIVRNPAYTGSIISLLGVALACGNLLGIVATVIICSLCYGRRIRVEEKALKEQFPQEFEVYCSKTNYRLIPFLY